MITMTRDEFKASTDWVEKAGEGISIVDDDGKEVAFAYVPKSEPDEIDRLRSRIASLREALDSIAWTGTDCPAAMLPAEFEASRATEMIVTARRALKADDEAQR